MALIRVTKKTRAPRDGWRVIVCPHCNEADTVVNFSWKGRTCRYCQTAVKKTHWLILPKTREAPTQCLLCGKRTIYQSRVSHPYYFENPQLCYHCGFNQEDYPKLDAIANPVLVQCPWIVGTARCSQSAYFDPATLAGRYLSASYPDEGFHYPGGTVPCQRCGRSTTFIELVLNNIDVLAGRSSEV